MRHPPHFHPPEFSLPRRRRAEVGIAMAVVLVVMVLLSLFGIMLLVATNQNQLIGKNERDIAICRQAAEAATREGISLATARYNVITRYSTILVCAPKVPGGACPLSLADLSPASYADKPGHAIDNAWTRKLFRGNGANDSRSVYVTSYARNNLNEPLVLNGANTLANDCVQTVVANVCDTDRDASIVIIGEAVMTFDGAAPLADYTNVKVRKMIAAAVRMPLTTLAGYCKDPKNQHSSYCQG